MLDLVLICPVRPDLDCVGGSLAYADYCQQAKGWRVGVYISGTPDGEAQFYLNHLQLADQLVDTATAQAAPRVALVDFSTKDILPDGIDPLKVITVIDHRTLHDAAADFPQAEIQLEQVGAAATLVAEYFMQNNLVPRAASATMLHGAIWSNNLGFHSSLTTVRDKAAYLWARASIPNADELLAAQLAARRADILHDLPAVLELETKLYRFGVRPYYFTQLELSDVDGFWQDHQADIETQLSERAIPTLLNMIDVVEGSATIYCTDENLQQALSNLYGIAFLKNLATMNQAQLRKQIAAALQQVAAA